MTLEDLTDLSVGDDALNLDDGFMPKKGKQRQESQDVVPYNPFMVRPNMTWDDRTMDRMLTIKRPIVESGEMWITESGFAETLSLLPLNHSEQKMFWRKFKKIQMLASGECNKKVIDSRQERLMMELVSQKSRLDVSASGNLNEREMWVTTRQQLEQSLKTPPPTQQKGFFSSVVGGLTGRK